MRTDPAAAVEKALRGRADVFLLGTVSSDATWAGEAGHGVCELMPSVRSWRA